MLLERDSCTQANSDTFLVAKCFFMRCFVEDSVCWMPFRLCSEIYSFQCRFHLITSLGQDLPKPRTYPGPFGIATLDMMPRLTVHGEGRPHVVDEPNGPAIFNSMSWNSDQTWEEARLKALVVYLRGNRHLNMPPLWKRMFPKHF